MDAGNIRGEHLRIGIGVEGISDKMFWDKILHKHFQGHRFDIRNMKCVSKLVRNTPTLVDSFRSLHYDFAFIIIDADDAVSASEVLTTFSDDIQSEAQKPLNDRYLHIFVACRDMEAWFLADQNAINTLLPKCNYTVPASTDTLGRKDLIKLWKTQYGRKASFNTPNFAEKMAPLFDPTVATNHSCSFSHTWSRQLSLIV